MTTATMPRALGLWFADFDIWNHLIQIASEKTLPEDWEIVPIRQIVSQVSEKVQVVPSKEYKMAGVKWYGEGIFHRETVFGKDLSAKYITPCIKNALMYNRLFAWKESFAIVPEVFTDCCVSNEFPQFIIDDNKALPEYLYLLFITNAVIHAVKSASVGSSAVSRNRFKEEAFCSFKVPLPPLPVQQKIVDYWHRERNQFQTIQEETENFRTGQYNELLKYCKLDLMEPAPRKGAFAMDWAEVYRWDTFFYRKDFCSLDGQLYNVKCEALGNIINFVSRAWSKKDFPDGTFEYIEISSVDKEHGITSTKTININSAPSRATTLLKKDNVILSTARPYLGAFAIVPDRYDNCVCTSGFALADGLKSKHVDKEYLLYFLKSDAGLRQMERYMTGGLYPAIVQDELEKIKVPIPDLAKQQDFVKRIKEEESKQTLKFTQATNNFVKIKQTIESVLLGRKKIEEI